MLSKKIFGGPRPKSAHHTSVRGRISGPIPIPAPEDDDFPIRQPGTNYADNPPDEEFPIRRPGHARVASTIPIAAAPFDKETLSLAPSSRKVTSAPLKKEEGPAPEPESSDSEDVASPRGPEVEQVPENREQPQPPAASETPVQPPTGPPSAGAEGSGTDATMTALHRRTQTNQSNTVRYSQISATSTGDDGRPTRKKSTLRGALSKLFGRRKKTGSQSVSETSRMSQMMTASDQQHRSDTSTLGRVVETESKRSASLPISEFDRALRSHSVGPNDITAIEEAARNSLQFDSSPQRRRAATFVPRLRPQGNGEWGGLSPRPASNGRRLSLTEHVDSGDQDSTIGRAITSDINGDFTGRRRSRSLSGLQDLASRPQSRRRSDEIRYWRESYEPGPLSPLSSGNDGEGDNGDPEGGAEGDEEYIGHAGTASVEHHNAMPPKTPPQPFHFGPMAGMKITQAASMDVRLDNLETKVHKIERTVSQLCHSVPGFRGPLAEFTPADQIPRSFPDPYTTSSAAPMIPAIYQAISADRSGSSRYSSSRQSVETDANSHLSFGEGQTYIGSLHPPSSSATHDPGLVAMVSPEGLAAPTIITSANRPTSTSTIRGVASLPSLSRSAAENPTTVEELAAQLESERAARQALEAQVRKLSERLNGLSKTMFAVVGGPGRTRSQERLSSSHSMIASPVSLAVPPMPGRPATRSIFEEDSDVEEIKKRAGSLRRDTLGMTTESEMGDLETPSEVFQTPTEETPIYGAFGEELRAEDDTQVIEGVEGTEGDDSGEERKRKKAARTLSLSQLTLGKRQPAQI